MERFAAMVAGRRAAPDPTDAPAEVEEVKEEKPKKKMTKEDEAYLSIQLEEIVIVKNEDIGNPGAAHGGGNTQCSAASGRASASPFMEQCASAAAAPPAGSSTAAAARGALTTVARMVGFD